MKIKVDFVTNSSSTSYVIATQEKLNSVFSKTGNILIDIFFELFTPRIITEIEDVKEFAEDYYGFEEDDERCIQMIDAIKNGGSIIYFNIPYGGEISFSDNFLRNHKSDFIIDGD